MGEIKENLGTLAGNELRVVLSSIQGNRNPQGFRIGPMFHNQYYRLKSRKIPPPHFWYNKGFYTCDKLRDTDSFHLVSKVVKTMVSRKGLESECLDSNSAFTIH